VSSFDELRPDEVVLAIPDMQGRLQGIRLGAAIFAEEVADRDYGCCAYLLAADVEMHSGAGYAHDP
jgi:glutamine synthetase